VDTWDLLRKGGRRLALCGLTPYCFRFLRTLHLDKVFDIYATPKAALENKGQHGQRGEERAHIAPVRVHISEVAWDPDLVREEYVGDDDVPIRSVIRPRQRSNRLLSGLEELPQEFAS